MSEQEPSMEDILSSIRNILSEDDKPKTSETVADEAKESEVKEVVVEPEEAEPDIADNSDADDKIVDLTEDMMVEASSSEPVGTPLISEDTEDAAKNSLLELADKVRQSSTPPKVPFGDGATTLEDMVKDMMRPLLKEWLDENLPEIVERVVKKEIRRVTDKIDM